MPPAGNRIITGIVMNFTFQEAVALRFVRLAWMALVVSAFFTPIAPAQPPEFDHSHCTLDSLLKSYVLDGRVDYEGLATERATLEAYIESLGKYSPYRMRLLSREQKLALYINAYNAFCLELVLSHYPLDSIKDIEKPFEEPIFILVGEKLNLDRLKTMRILGAYEEPLLHFALASASAGGPRLRNQAWTPMNITRQLVDAVHDFVRDPARNHLDKEAGVLRVSKIFEWHGRDFIPRWNSTLLPEGSTKTAQHRAIVGFFMEYGSDDVKAFLEENPVTIEYLDFDWSLNAVQGD